MSYADAATRLKDSTLSSMSVPGLSAENISAILSRASLPAPLDKLLQNNLEQQVYKAANIPQDVGHYVTQTIVSALMNVLCFVACFIAAMIAGGIVGTVLKSLPKNMKSLTIAYTISGIVPSSVILPLWVMHDEYIETTSQMADQAYIDFLEKLSSSNWPIVAIYIGGFIGSFIGSLIARRAMKKHFKRIGLV